MTGVLRGCIEKQEQNAAHCTKNKLILNALAHVRVQAHRDDRAVLGVLQDDVQHLSIGGLQLVCIWRL